MTWGVVSPGPGGAVGDADERTGHCPVRRNAGQLAVGLILLSTVEPVAAGALLVALFSVAVYRPFRPVAAIGVLLPLLVLSWGMVVRSRRQLVVTLRERARRAEAGPDSAPSRRSGWPARPSPGRCTMSSPTG